MATMATIGKDAEEQLPWSVIVLLACGIPTLVIDAAQYPLVIGAGLAALLWGAIAGRRDPVWRRTAIGAAVLGTAGEAICVLPAWFEDGRGLWEYRFPNPFGLAWELPIWLPIVWADLLVLFIALGRRIPQPPVVARPGVFRYLAVLAIVAHALAAARVVRIEILFGLAPFLAALLLWWNTPRDLGVYGVAALLGTFGEILAMREGLWIYTAPAVSFSFLKELGVPGVPISLPMAWGLCAVFVRRWGERVR